MFVTWTVGPATGGPDQTVLPGSVLGVPAHPVRVEHGAAPPQGKPGAIPDSAQPRGTRFCQHKISMFVCVYRNLEFGIDSVNIRLACLSVYTGS